MLLVEQHLGLLEVRGTEVANETTVNPITILGSLNLKERPTDALTRYSPPITKKIKPISIKKNSIR